VLRYPVCKNFPVYVSWLVEYYVGRGRGRGRENDEKEGKKKRGKEPSMEQWYKQWKTLTVHPNLRIDYFEKIDDRQKAYWLGFLFADGFLVATNPRTGAAQIGIKLSRKDEGIIDKFCESIGLTKTKKTYEATERSERVRILFCCKKMSGDLRKHGLMFRKSKIIQYPKTSLHSRELELAFLLGYYDGDGTQNRTIVSSGSKRFLEQVKDRFGLSNEVLVDSSDRESNGRKTRGTKYLVSLGPKLLNEMMDSYADSMPRKHRLFCDSEEERVRRTAETCTPEKVRKRRELQREWRNIKREELEKLVQEMPLKQIAIKYNLSSQGHHVSKKCKKFSISTPQKGYWARRGSLERNSKAK